MRRPTRDWTPFEDVYWWSGKHWRLYQADLDRIICPGCVSEIKTTRTRWRNGLGVCDGCNTTHHRGCLRYTTYGDHNEQTASLCKDCLEGSL